MDTNFGDKGFAAFLSTAISAVFSVVLSLAVELVPPFAKWWDTKEDSVKRAIRGWTGLVIAAVAVAFVHFAEIYVVDVTSTKSVLLALFTVLSGWVSFVLGGQTTFETAYPMLPRKRG